MKYEIFLPVKDDVIKKLKVKDIVYLSGMIVSARDQVHKRIIDHIDENKPLPEAFNQLEGSAIYHCGPIIKKSQGKYQFISGGPTTSRRMDLLENDVVKILKVKFIIGKGGMKNLDTKGNSVVYLSYTGGCGAIINQKIEDITHVEWEDLGTSEAAWFIKVKDFGPLIVSQDVNGNSLYKTF